MGATARWLLPDRRHQLNGRRIWTPPIRCFRGFYLSAICPSVRVGCLPKVVTRTSLSAGTLDRPPPWWVENASLLPFVSNRSSTIPCIFRFAISSCTFRSFSSFLVLPIGRIPLLQSIGNHGGGVRGGFLVLLDFFSSRGTIVSLDDSFFGFGFKNTFGFSTLSILSFFLCSAPKSSCISIFSGFWINWTLAECDVISLCLLISFLFFVLVFVSLIDSFCLLTNCWIWFQELVVTKLRLFFLLSVSCFLFILGCLMWSLCSSWLILRVDFSFLELVLSPFDLISQTVLTRIFFSLYLSLYISRRCIQCLLIYYSLDFNQDGWTISFVLDETSFIEMMYKYNICILYWYNIISLRMMNIIKITNN